HFVLEADINLDGFGGRAGDSVTPFTGSFDGQGHKIANYNYSATTHSGVFGRVVGNGTTTGLIRNLTLARATISGSSYVGGVVGLLDGGRVSNTAVIGSSANVSVEDGGGLVGRNLGTIEDVFSDVTVTGTSGATNVGGVVGYSSGTVERAIATR